MRVWHALQRLLRAVVRDPLWAVGALATSPWYAGRHLLRVLLLSSLVGTCLMLAADWMAILLAIPLAGVLHALGWQTTPVDHAVHLVLWSAAGGVTLVFLARQLVAPLLLHFGERGGDSHGSARFASAAELAPLLAPRAAQTSSADLLLGRDLASGRLLRYPGAAHLLTLAPTRAGKGVGTLIPNLLMADRSVVCVDPKGENTRLTARARAQFGPVHVLDPFGITGQVLGQPSAVFNPLTGLDPDSLDGPEQAATLAEALVYDPPGATGEAHWNEEAKALLTGLLLAVAAEATPEHRTLATLRAWLSAPPLALAAQLTRLQDSAAAGGLVARAANRHLGKDPREASGVLSAAQRHTHFLDSPRMTAVLGALPDTMSDANPGRASFRFEDLQERTATVFLVLPPDRLGAYARWLRLLVTHSLQALAQRPVWLSPGSQPAPGAAVLYLLDEFAALGHLPAVERAMGLMAGYGVQLWPMLQDVHQLRALYGQSAGSFLANAGVLQVFGVNDHDSARLVSALLGQATVEFETMSRTLDAPGTGLTFATHATARALLTPDEVRRLPQEQQLLLLAGQRPIVAHKLRYYAEHEFAGRFEAG